jgi:hypothetical protein
MIVNFFFFFFFFFIFLKKKNKDFFFFFFKDITPSYEMTAHHPKRRNTVKFINFANFKIGFIYFFFKKKEIASITI